MALLEQAKQVARQDILAGIDLAKKDVADDIKLRTIKYKKSGDKIVASAIISSGDKTVKINRQYGADSAGDAIQCARKILASLGALEAIMAAGEDDDIEGPEMDPVVEPEFVGDNNVTDAVDDLADAVEDIQDDLQDIQEDEVTIHSENNIEGHLIAECEKCTGIFISAMVKSDQKVDSITGVCPLCGKESIQKFKWVIDALEYEDGTLINI